MQGASGLDCGNECNQVIFNFVWPDTECWKSHDTDTCMIVQRETEIDGFKPEPIYRLSISCGGITALSDRFEKKQDAENILNVLKEQKVAQVTKIDPADKQEKAPQLYSLTALQRDANRFLGFTAQQILDYTQSLYEKKLVTYPRTDSRFLTEDMESMIHDLAGKMAAKFGYTRKMVVHPKQVIKNSKVSDHHAIILRSMWQMQSLVNCHPWSRRY